MNNAIDCAKSLCCKDKPNINDINNMISILEIFKKIFTMSATQKPVEITELKNAILFPLFIRALYNVRPLNLKVVENYSYYGENCPITFIAKRFYIHLSSYFSSTQYTTPSIEPLDANYINNVLNKVTINKKYDNLLSYELKIHYIDNTGKKRFKCINSYGSQMTGYSNVLDKIHNLIMALKFESIIEN